MLPTDVPTNVAAMDEEIILGVDTHNDAHVAAVITVLGALVDTQAFPTTAAGYTALVSWARGHGRLRRAGVEGTSSHGTALTRHLHRQGVQVIEVNRPDRAVRRRPGKTDAVDAENAARAVLSGQATGLAKSGDGAVEMIRMFKIAKDSAVKARTQAINQLKAVLVRADPTLRESLSGLGRVALIRACAALPSTTDHSTHAATTTVLRSLARRVLALTDETRTLQQQMRSAIAACAPQLLDQYGVGPDTAAARPLHHRPDPARPRPTYPRLRHQTGKRGQIHKGNHSLPEALRRPRGLPSDHRSPATSDNTEPGDLTNIGASSRSIASSTFSRRNRANSARSSSDSPPAAAATPRAWRSFFTQFARVPSLMPRSRATCAIDVPVSRTHRTAPHRTAPHRHGTPDRTAVSSQP